MAGALYCWMIARELDVPKKKKSVYISFYVLNTIEKYASERKE